MAASQGNQIIEAMAWLLKLAFKIVLGLVAVAAIGGAGWYGYHYWTVELPKSQILIEARYALEDRAGPWNDYQRREGPVDLLSEESDEELTRRLQERLAAARTRLANNGKDSLPTDAPSDDSDFPCVAGYPLRTVIVNNSRRTLDAVRFSFVARVPKHSTNLVHWERASGSSDRILRPGERVGYCWSLPRLTSKDDPATLEWSAVIKSAEFSD